MCPWNFRSPFFLNDSIVKNYGIWDPKYVARFLNKFKNGVPENVGYRDNMLICFMLSTQIIQYWINNPIKHQIIEHDIKIKINDYKKCHKFTKNTFQFPRWGLSFAMSQKRVSAQLMSGLIAQILYCSCDTKLVLVHSLQPWPARF